MRTFILILCLLCSGLAQSYDACQPYHPYNNPNPSVPCSYNGYDYDSLAVEAGVNSFFYKGQNYTLTDNDWWWALLSQPYETCDGLMVAWGTYNCSHNLSFSKSGALFFGPGASYGAWQLTVNLAPQAGGTVTSSPASDFSCSNGACQGGFSGNVTLTATAASGCLFSYWNDGTIMSSDNPLTVTMSGDKTLSAVFICSLQWPLSGSKESRTTTLGFGADWVDSCGGQIEKHAGIDVSATAGEDVNAAIDGIVSEIYTGQHSLWADAVVIKDSANSFTTVYWHINPTVSVNGRVVKGNKIGTVANLGSNTHFHFGIRARPFVAGKSDKGALPQQNGCDNHPAFPEYFIDPDSITYE